MANINKITVGETTYNITLPAGLTEEEQAQIRANIGAVSAQDVEVVRDGTYPEMTVGEATHAQNADNAINATNAQNAVNSVNAQNATNDSNGNKITETYATKTEVADDLTLQKWLDIVYPVGGNERYIQLPKAPTPASKFPNTTWEIDTDLLGRVLIGSGGKYVCGATGGEEKHILKEGEMAEHRHGGIRLKWSNNDIPAPVNKLNVNGVNVSAQTNGIGRAVIDHPDDFTNPAGGSTPFSIMQPYVVINYWKRTA